MAFSITISATATWRVAGSSKVEETTSPFTVRGMSVTSSGRSSIKQNDQEHFRVVGFDRLGDVLQDDGFTRARLRDDERALAFADRRDDVDDAAGFVFQRRVFDFHLQPLGRVERGQIVEVDLVADACPGSSKLTELTFVSAK